jgi:hypothetical protein
MHKQIGDAIAAADVLDRLVHNAVAARAGSVD